MCGRYALALRASAVRQSLADSNMPSQDAPDDDDVRQTYNFAPGYYGLVYRAELPSRNQPSEQDIKNDAKAAQNATEECGTEKSANQTTVEEPIKADSATDDKPEYTLQSMKWGLVPFWTKRNPDYGSMMRTINCRDDSLANTGGMWQHVKQKKRCIVLAQGFYEWLKKDGGKTKVPHYVKRKDGQLMCFAGLWDRCAFEEKDGGDGHEVWTYTIITTDSNKQLGFLHDRMPVILENGSKEMFTWLDASRTEWSNDLQSLLKPYQGELECYPVPREVGKVGNDSASFIVPLDQNKQSINNFFSNQQKKESPKKPASQVSTKQQSEDKAEKVETKPDEDRATQNTTDEENNAPMPTTGTKREHEETTDAVQTAEEPASKKTKPNEAPTSSPGKKTSPQKPKPSPQEGGQGSPKKGSTQGSPKPEDGSMKITSFFGK